MGIRINQNIMAMNSYRNLTTSESQLSKSLEKLSSGFRINKAADDASGLVISEGLRSQVMGLKMAIRNTQDGVSVVQTAEGALTEVHSLLQRIRELAVQAASTGSSDPDARAAAQKEVDQLKAEVDRIAGTTKFGGQNLLNGDYGVLFNEVAGTGQAGINVTVANNQFSIEVNGTGAEEVTLSTFNYNVVNSANAQALEDDIRNQTVAVLAGAGKDYEAFDVQVDIEAGNFVVKFNATADGGTVDLTTGTTDILVGAAGSSLGIANASQADTSGSGGVFQVGTEATDTITFAIQNTDTTTLGINLVDIENDATGALDDLDDAIADISVLRGALGALQNRFEHTIANLSVTVENLSASESRIRDTDMASEMMSFTRAQILQQAGTAMLAQANAVPQSVLQLLQQ